jgi:hypothetical protein
VPAFKVRLNGRNLLIEMDGELAKFGFVTMRHVEAADQSEAEGLAVDALRRIDSLREAVKNSADDPPRVYVEEIIEITAIDPAAPTPGLSWYPEEDNSADEAS